MKKLTGLIFLLLLIACTDNGDPVPLDYTKIFSGEISKTWSLKSLAFRDDGEEFWKISNSCWADDSYTFYRDAEKKFEFESGSIKCDATEERITIVDTWSFVNGTSTLYFVLPIFSANPLPFTVVDVDKNDMTLELFFNESGTQSYEIKLKLEDEE